MIEIEKQARETREKKVIGALETNQIELHGLQLPNHVYGYKAVDIQQNCHECHKHLNTANK